MTYPKKNIEKFSFSSFSKENRDHQVLNYISSEIKSIVDKYELSCFYGITLPSNGIEKFHFSEWSGLEWKVDNDDDFKVMLAETENINDIFVTNMVICHIFEILLKKLPELEAVHKCFCKKYNLNKKSEMILHQEKYEQLIKLNNIYDVVKVKGHDDIYEKICVSENLKSYRSNEMSNKLTPAFNEIFETVKEFSVCSFFLVIGKTCSCEWFSFSPWSGLAVKLEDGIPDSRIIELNNVLSPSGCTDESIQQSVAVVFYNLLLEQALNMGRLSYAVETVISKHSVHH